MNNSNKQNTGQDGSTGKMPDEAFGPMSAEDTRTLILRSRAISEGEARLAATINGIAPGDRPQCLAEKELSDISRLCISVCRWRL